jgi:hypothetical protein
MREGLTMTKVQKLQAALHWALTNGAHADEYGGRLEFSDRGCGCCSSEIQPPEELRAVIVEALKPQCPR